MAKSSRIDVDVYLALYVYESRNGHKSQIDTINETGE